MSITGVILALVALEAALLVAVRRMRRGFQWLITEADELPALDEQALRRFVDTSYDARLGWVRRPGTSGVEKGQRGRVEFHIDAQGARQVPGLTGPVRVASFGDSYVFCRQVEDGETWQAQLSRRTGLAVANFGVGNYGADQALLRYEGTSLPDTVKLVVLGFVPETICRVQSYWKHYLEFGNTFAFKPRFTLEASGELKLLANPVQGPGDFARLRDIVPQVRAADGFYRRKFRKLQFRFPYLVSFLRHPLRHGQLMAALGLRGVLRLLRASTTRIEQLPFKLVMARNIREAHRMYAESGATELLTAILMRFKEHAQARGHVPLVLVMPQLLDLDLHAGTPAPYRKYFRDLEGQVAVLDLTDELMVHDLRSLFVEDQHGGHLSVQGNRIVAERLDKWLRDSNVLNLSAVS